MLAFSLTTLLGCSFILIPWAVRGLLLSGCIAYPFTIGCVTNLEWTIPLRVAEGEAAWIKSWARQPQLPPEVVLSSWDWFRPWVGRVLSNIAFQISIGLLLLGIGLVASTRLTRPSVRTDKDPFVPSFLVALGGMTFWFLSAPDPRFGKGYLFSLALLVLCFGLMCVGISESKKGARILMFTFILLLPLVRVGVAMIPLTRAVRLIEWPRVPEVRVVQRETIEGVGIYTPAEGSQCWFASVPCTHEFNRDLRVRRSASGLPEKFWFVK
jgi:hypothetical protein